MFTVLCLEFQVFVMPNKTVFKNTVFEDKTRPPIKKENVYCNSKRNFRAYNEKKKTIYNMDVYE